MDRFGAFTVAALLAVACSSGGGSTPGGGDPPPPAITVSGTVVDEAGRPYPGAWVTIGTAGVFAAADGTFTIPNVAAPYDVTVVAEGDRTITQVRGVSATAPVLSFVRQNPGAPRTATVQGTATPETRTGHYPYVFGPETWTAPSLSGTYTLAASWHGDASTTLNVREILLDTGVTDGWPVGYAYGARPVAVTDGGAVAGQDLAASWLTAGHVTGTVSVSGVWHLPFSIFRMVPAFADGTAFTLFERGWDSAPLGAFDVVVPALPDGAFRLEYATRSLLNEDASVSAPVLPGQTAVAIDPPPPPAITSGVLSGRGFQTVLTWETTNFTGSDFVTIACESGHVFRIAGRMRAASLPNPSTRAIAVPAGTACDWRAGWASYTIDELVRGPATLAALPVVETSLSAYDRFWF